MATPPDLPLILASRSPRRRQLLEEHGYRFEVQPASDWAECGVCSGESPPVLVARLAYQKAKEVAAGHASVLVIGCDTVAECRGQILGKPRDREHAAAMLRLLRGQTHHVYSGVCIWRRPDNVHLVDGDRTRLRMSHVTDETIEEYLDTDLWVGKAGGFGYQDGLDWVCVEDGSESNVVGLPMELLASMLQRLRAIPIA